MLEFNEEDIRRRCGSGPTEAGRRYHRQARVVDFAREGDIIRSAVKGTAKLPYRQTITLKERRDSTDVMGACTCPVGSNCKHVAAALFHAMTVASVAGTAANPEHQLARPLGTASHPPASRMGGPAASADPDLPAGLLAWLDDLARAAGSSGEEYPPDLTQRMIYVLVSVRDDPRMPQLGVQPVAARLRKDGTFAANSRPYSANSGTPGGPAYFRPSDRRIMRDLSRLPMIHAMTIYRLTDDVGAEVLALILETGRARWHALDGPTLGPGPARNGTLSWAEAGAGALLPRLAIEGAAVVLAATPPVYVDPTTGRVGPIETGQPARIAAALFRAPPVAATALAALNDRLARRAPALAGLAPRPPPPSGGPA